VTVYGKAYGRSMKIQQMDMRADATNGYPGRGYRYYTGKPLFAAFEGLSYTTFETSCKEVKAAQNNSENKTLTLSCTVKNTGARDGDAVLLLFHRPPQTTTSALAAQRQRPIRRLLDFHRVAVAAGKRSAPQLFVVQVRMVLMLLVVLVLVLVLVLLLLLLVVLVPLLLLLLLLLLRLLALTSSPAGAGAAAAAERERGAAGGAGRARAAGAGRPELRGHYLSGAARRGACLGGH